MFSLTDMSVAQAGFLLWIAKRISLFLERMLGQEKPLLVDVR